MLLTGQAEKLRHMKRKQNDMKVENERLQKETMIFHEANMKLKEQIKDLKDSGVSPERTLDPAIAKEIKNVA